MDEVSTQLKQIEELLCYILMILKRTNPTDLVGPSDLVDTIVATEAPEADPKPLITTFPQPKSSPSKKGKKKRFFFLV